MTFEELLKCDKNNEKNYDALKEKCKAGKIIPFVGAGLSIPPYLGWRASLEELVSSCDSSVGEELKDLLNKDLYEDAADFIVDSLGKGQFEQDFKELFSEEKIKNIGISNSMRLLPDLFPAAVITTNFDKCIETSYSEKGNLFSSVITPKDAATLDDYITQITRNNAHFLWKIHGDIDCFNKRVFTSKEYNETYQADPKVKETMYNFFRNSQLLFLGCSLSGNDRYMAILKKLGKNTAINNYALVQIPEDKKKFAECKKRLSDHWIFPIWYPAEDAQHESVCIILRQLIQDLGDDKVTDIDDTYSKNNVSDYIEEKLARRGLKISIPREEGITIDDLVAIGVGKEKGYLKHGLSEELYDYLGEVYDRKYKDMKVVNDTRGHDDRWKTCFSEILKEQKINDIASQKVVIVGIGNGEEGAYLGYKKINDADNLILADIAEKSLNKAKSKYSKAICIKQPAQDLSKVISSSVNLYISLRVYQSTFFNIDKALYEALRVLKKGGTIIISISNGFINKVDNSYIPGLIAADGQTIDRNKSKQIAEYVINKMRKLSFKKIKSKECMSEIFV